MVDDPKKAHATTILVAESEATARVSLSELLRDEGHSVVEAADNVSAVSELSRDPSIQVILVDIEMPSWTSIIQQARLNLPNSFILGMVRYGALANALQAKQLGANTHLVKPLSFAEVNQWIQRYLTGKLQFTP